MLVVSALIKTDRPCNNLHMPISRAQIILVIASMLLGGIAGTGITSYHLKKKHRVEIAIRYLLGSRYAIDELDLLGQSNIVEVKKRTEESLALCVLTAEVFAQGNDKAGEIGKETLRVTASHRLSPSYIQEEAALRKIIAMSEGKPPKTLPPR